MITKKTKSRSMSNDHERYVGVDIHERESQIAVFDPSGSLLQEKRLPTAALQRFIESLPGEKRVAVESVGFIYPVYDKLSQIANCVVSVANPKTVNLIAKSKLKHDKTDAKVLGELLRTNYLPLSYLPDQATREERFLINDRVKYGLRRAQLKVTIKWLLKRKGIKGVEARGEKPFGPEGQKKLSALSLREIDIRLDELELVESIVKRLDEEIARTVAMDEKAKLLDTLPGTAPYTALFLASHIGDINRFPDSKHMCADLGLAPSLHQTGDISFTGHITKTGNKWLRRT
ncbi:MAG TPA: transposase [Nitrososphaerales archaeon]|nr:transposase [Nitrososphaerales archaeon]